MNEQMKKMGRPRKAKEIRSILVALRVTPSESKAWRKAAKAAGLTLSEWILEPRRGASSGK